jgi:hypothetical protein
MLYRKQLWEHEQAFSFSHRNRRWNDEQQEYCAAYVFCCMAVRAGDVWFSTAIPCASILGIGGAAGRGSLRPF